MSTPWERIYSRKNLSYIIMLKCSIDRSHYISSTTLRCSLMFLFITGYIQITRIYMLQDHSNRCIIEALVATVAFCGIVTPTNLGWDMKYIIQTIYACNLRRDFSNNVFDDLWVNMNYLTPWGLWPIRRRPLYHTSVVYINFENNRSVPCRVCRINKRDSNYQRHHQ